MVENIAAFQSGLHCGHHTTQEVTQEKGWNSLLTVDLSVEEIDKIRHKLNAAAYVKGGKDFGSLFERLDKDKNGRLDQHEFHDFCRHMWKVVKSSA